MPRLLKFSLVFLISLTAIIWGAGAYFYKNNSQFRYWWNLPLENRALSVQLEIERPFLNWFFNEIEEDSFSNLTPGSLKSSVQLGANWIVNMQEESGRFNYWYDPEKDTFSSKSEDNFLRQAGTSYSLLSAFELLRDSALLQPVQKSLAYLNQFRVNHTPDTSYYLYRQKAKLGGTALPMLVMLKFKELSGDTIYDQRLKSLANMILHLQKVYGTGQYKSTYVYNGSFEYEKNTGWESNIYPGEAMLALTEMYAAFGDEKYLNSLDQAHSYYSEEGRWRHFSFMPWATIAMSRLAILTSQKKYADFAFEMTDRILYWQNLNQGRVTYGSLFGVPTVFTATWIEGVAEAWKLAIHLNLNEKSERYFRQTMISYKWLLQLQISEQQLQAKGYSEPSLGGFSRSLIEPSIRIDNTQHAISAIIKGLEAIE